MFTNQVDKTIIKNAYILFGKELQVIENGTLLINEYGTIEDVIKEHTRKSSKELTESYYKDSRINIVDAEGYIIIPGLINSHIHIGDSIAKDLSSNSDMDTRIHPHHSVKKTVLDRTPQTHLMQMIRNTTVSMLHKGITTFVDFREGGLDGVNLLKSAIKNIPIKSIILGRLDISTSNEHLQNNQNRKRNNDRISEIKTSDKINLNEQSKIINRGKRIVNACNGFGISGANENTDEMLLLYKEIVKEYKLEQELEQKHLNNNRISPLIAIHASESQTSVKESIKNNKKTEIERTVTILNPDIYVHVTNPSKTDLELLYQNKKGIVICPRANGILGVGFAPIKKMLEFNFELAIGTDNVMLNSPDIFREMDFLIKSQRALEKDVGFLDAKKVLKMATVNASKIFNLDTGCIDKGYQADLLFIDKYDIDLYPVYDPYMSIVHRCSERQVKAVMINGSFVLEKTVIN